MKRKFRFSFLLLVGILLLAAGLIGLTTVPDIMQYAFLPPETEAAPAPADTGTSPEDAADGLQADPEDPADESLPAAAEDKSVPLLEKYDDAVKTMGELFHRVTLHSIKTDAALSATNGRDQSSINLYAVGPCWNEVYTPRIVKGRPIVRLDMEQKSKVIVIDDDTAFALFTDRDPIGQIVKLGGVEYEVVGVAEHSRRIGETGEHDAWVPLDLVTDGSLMVLSSPSASTSLFAVFTTKTKTLFAGGTAVSLAKEKTRAMLPLLLVFLVAAIWLMKRWIGWLAGFGRIRAEKVRAESKRRYALKLMPYAAGKMLPVVLLTALTVAACFGLAILALHPMRIFPEWIPETLGEYTSWIARFWDLAGTAAKPLSFRTPEMAEVQFWGSLILWGTLLILLRAARNTLTGFGRKNEDD